MNLAYLSFFILTLCMQLICFLPIKPSTSYDNILLVLRQYV